MYEYFNKNTQEGMYERRRNDFEITGMYRSDNEINTQYELDYYLDICKKKNLKSNNDFLKFLNNEDYDSILSIYSFDEIMVLFENGNILNDDQVQHISEASENLDILIKEAKIEFKKFDHIKTKQKNKYIDTFKIFINNDNKEILENLAGKSGKIETDKINSSFYTTINGVNNQSKGYLLVEISSYVDLVQIRKNGVNQVLNNLNLDLNKEKEKSYNIER